jgi:uncharacterized Tic20 family protein
VYNDNSLFGQLFNNQNKEKPKEKTKAQKLAFTLTVSAFLLYPFLVVGFFPFLAIQWLEKREEMNHVEDMEYKTLIQRHTTFLGVISFLLFLGNCFLFIFVLPRGYFSCYLLFPFNLIHTSLKFNNETIIALLCGGIGMTAALTTIHSFASKRKVQSKEDKRRAIQQSIAYKKRQNQKFSLSQEETEEYERLYREAKRRDNFESLEEMKQWIFLGTDEYGKSYYMPFKEFNQHALFVGTTGSGKTTALELLIDHCAKFDLPCLVLDGKGAKDTLVAAQKISELRGKDVINFSDTGNVSYNPIKYGLSTALKDKLIELAKTESIYYSGTSELLIMNTIQLLDKFEIKRTLLNFTKYLLPRNVLLLFSDELLQVMPDLFEFKVVKKPEKEKNAKKKEVEMEQLEEELAQLEEEVVAHEEEEYITLDPEIMPLEQLYEVISHSKECLQKQSLELFDQLFTRYEHKQNVFYLYATSENLQTQMNILMDSDIGHLFDTENNHNELDLARITRNGDIAYVSLNGLVYTKFIRTMAHFIVSDINYLAAERYEISETFPFVVLFDEPSAYLTDQFIDTVNKTRGAGLHAIFSPQTLADIETIDPLIMRQLIGNVNTYFVGQTNEPKEIDYWLKLFGTFDDIEVTSMVEQQGGYSDVSKTDWVAERGTQRNVENFIVRGQTLRDLRTGEFIVYRKGNNTREPIRKVYLRKVV